MSEERVFQTLKGNVGVQIIRDYIMPILDRDESLIKRINLAKTLPSLIVSVAVRIVRTDILANKLLAEIEFYRKHGIDLSPIDRKKGLIDWYLENAERRENEDINRWLDRVAIASLIIVSEAYVGQEMVKENIVARYIREQLMARRTGM